LRAWCGSAAAPHRRSTWWWAIAPGRGAPSSAPSPACCARVPIVRAADLVLLKLYAADPQDLWDIQRLPDAAPDKESLLAAVESGLADLGESARAAWRQVLGN